MPRASDARRFLAPLAAVQEGVDHVQGTMNGIGERTGNANLVSIIPNLELGLGYDLVGEERLRKLTTQLNGCRQRKQCVQT